MPVLVDQRKLAMARGALQANGAKPVDGFAAFRYDAGIRED
jgi:hypothetical protein